MKIKKRTLVGAKKALQTRIRNANSGKSDPMTRTEFRLLVCGSRDWPEDKADVIERWMFEAISKYAGGNLDNMLVIVGEADGADKMAHYYCHAVLGVACAQFHAPWEQHRRDYGNPRAAGPKRNGWMLRWGQPDYVLAFHPYIINSRGTKNLVEQARKMKIPVKIVEK